MKKFSLILLFAAVLASCAPDRGKVLKVYNWSTYIDESLIPEFEQWYEEQTGEEVHVIYQTFDVLENMLSKIEKGKEDYDVVCPSDYIIERMLKSNLLLPIDRNFGGTPDYTKNISPFITSWFDKIDGGGLNANDYSVGYMWGTTGLLYNTKYVTREQASTWEALRNPEFAGRIYMKDAPRDVASQILIHLNRDGVADGSVSIDSLMKTPSAEGVNAVEEWLKSARDGFAGWEADFGKEQMVKELGWINLNWSGDAEWAIEEAAESGVSLDFVCPREGFTIFFDGWVIPKYAKNVKAASYWINFLCREDVAIRNADEIGYVSVVEGQELLDHFSDDSYEPLDASYFFGEAGKEARLNPILYPDLSEMSRCGMEHDWGDDTHLLVEMWSRVKGDNANTLTVVIVGAVIAALVGFSIAGRVKKSRRNKRRNRNRR